MMMSLLALWANVKSIMFQTYTQFELKTNSIHFVLLPNDSPLRSLPSRKRTRIYLTLEYCFHTQPSHVLLLLKCSNMEKTCQNFSIVFHSVILPRYPDENVFKRLFEFVKGFQKYSCFFTTICRKDANNQRPNKQAHNVGSCSMSAHQLHFCFIL